MNECGKSTSQRTTSRIRTGLTNEQSWHISFQKAIHFRDLERGLEIAEENAADFMEKNSKEEAQQKNIKINLTVNFD